MIAPLYNKLQALQPPFGQQYLAYLNSLTQIENKIKEAFQLRKAPEPSLILPKQQIHCLNLRGFQITKEPLVLQRLQVVKHILVKIAGGLPKYAIEDLKTAIEHAYLYNRTLLLIEIQSEPTASRAAPFYYKFRIIPNKFYGVLVCYTDGGTLESNEHFQLVAQLSQPPLKWDLFKHKHGITTTLKIKRYLPIS